MQTEIDHFLTQQNALLSQQNSLLAEQNKVLNQQVDSLKNILSDYSEVEQNLKMRIKDLKSENEIQQAVILMMKAELSKLESSSSSAQVQHDFQEALKSQLHMQLMRAFNQLDLNSVVSKLVEAELEPIQTRLCTQQTDLEKALSTILQLKVPTEFYNDLEMQNEQISTLEDTVKRLAGLIENLNN